MQQAAIGGAVAIETDSRGTPNIWVSGPEKVVLPAGVHDERITYLNLSQLGHNATLPHFSGKLQRLTLQRSLRRACEEAIQLDCLASLAMTNKQSPSVDALVPGSAAQAERKEQRCYCCFMSYQAPRTITPGTPEGDRSKVTKRVVGAGAGALAGAILPIPFVGPVIGAIAGAALGPNVADRVVANPRVKEWLGRSR
jgi:hypothetical protein